MSKEKSLKGTRFFKIDEHCGFEDCHVLEHDKDGGRYLVAFIPLTSKSNDEKLGRVGEIRSNISWVYDWITENYAGQNQKKIAKLQKIDRKRCALVKDILSSARMHQQAPAAPAPAPPAPPAPPAAPAAPAAPGYLPPPPSDFNSDVPF